MIVDVSDGMRLDRGSIPLISINKKKKTDKSTFISLFDIKVRKKIYKHSMIGSLDTCLTSETTDY